MQNLKMKLTQLVCASAAALGLLGACTQKPPAAWSGYAEGDYVYVSSPIAGRVEGVAVRAGESVRQGAALFNLDASSEKLAEKEAEARAQAALAQANNLGSGKRREELAVTQAQLAQARAAEVLANSDLQRQQQLLAQGFVSKARADDAATAVAQARARVAELTAALQVAQLPGRTEEIFAQRANAQAAREALSQSQWRSGQKQQTAPADALVADVFFQRGEFVGAGQPVVSLLPPANIKARFFVPEADLGGIQMGQAVWLACDGCGKPMAAKISRIATQPEFTPPVIYSNAQRSKLVFMAEAQPSAADAVRLKPGQPLDVRPDVAPPVQAK
ncbi:HlyD family secretion protein [Rhodoferax aquaticus]|uniref:HlyD family secretion protein n=1 Tax=Rhodoferax aquaticus TaxID=2527691 RepID=A0A515END3_9BURK|nr:HlyD family secretion protein [Rhodoferax aquaticus]QDL54148.1 HlyD family secretion protein [Rhodoferax aquaticus]